MRAEMALALGLGVVGCSDGIGPGDPGPTPPGSTYAIVYEGRPDGAPELLRVRIAPDSVPERLLPAGTIGRSPSLSPDGKSFVFVAWDGEGIAQIYRIGRDGAGLVQLTDSGEDEDQPAWSPDGAWIAFRSYRRQVSGEIWVMRTDGSGARLVAGTDAGTAIEHGRPAWSPDGRRLAFTSTRGGDYGIWTVRLDGSELRQLTNTMDLDTEPSWSPDGLRIAFRRSSPEGSDIAFVPAEGGTVSVLALAGEQRMPVWSPDGTRLAVVTSETVFSPPRIVTMRPDGQDILVHTSADRWGGISPTWERVP